MYRLYRLLTDEKGNIIHKTPLARFGNLNTALSHARVWGNGRECGIYEIKDSGEVLVMRI